MSEQTTRASRLEIEGPDGIALKQLGPEDAPPLFELIDEDRPHLSQTHSGVFDDTADKYRTVEDVLRSIIKPKNPQKLRFGVWVNGSLVGSNNLTPLGGSRVESGSWIGGKHIGHGFAAGGRALLARLVFEQLGYDEIVSKIYRGNEASRRSVERSGFKYVGDEGKQWVYVLTRDDYEGQQANESVRKNY